MSEPRNGTMGLGRFAQIGNVTAMVIICGLFVYQSRDLAQSSREREERLLGHVEQVNKAASAGHEAARDLSRSVETLAGEVKQLRRDRQARAGQLELGPPP